MGVLAIRAPRQREAHEGPDFRDGAPASSTDSRTWADFAEVCAAFVAGVGDGVGFVVTKDDPYTGADFDGCVEGGKLTAWAADYVGRLGSYTEVSPSGTGVRVFVRGKLPPRGRKRGPVELYDAGRFLTVTGAHLEGTPERIEARQEALEALHAEAFGAKRNGARCEYESDLGGELPKRVADLAKADTRIRALLYRRAGELDYPSESEADLALANLLARAGCEAAEIDAALRWRRAGDGKDDQYFRRTVERALEGRQEQASTSAEPWPPLLRLEEPELPAFPLEALPPWLRTWATAQAEAQQVPPDLPGQLALATASAALAGRARVRVKPGHSEPLNLYTVSGLGPANRKSAAFEEATAPLGELEAELVREAAPAVARASSDLEILRGELAQAQRAATRAEPGERDAKRAEAQEIAAELAEAERRAPVYPRLLCDDTTPEALAALLEQQGGCMALFAPEGGELFELMRGRYSQNARANVGVYLKAWSGDPLRVDRRGREPVVVEHPLLTVCLTVQPSVIRELGEARELRGRGLLGRFLYSMPQSRLGSRDTRTPVVPEALAAEYRARIRALARLPREGREVALEPAALEAWYAFAEALEPRLAESGDLGAIADWAGKLAGTVARLAGILHALEWADQPDPLANPVEALTVERAATLGGYYVEHARAAFGLMGADTTAEAARKLWRWIEEAGLAEVSKRDLWQQFKGGLVNRAEELDAPLRLLCDHGYLRRQIPRKGPGRRPERYDVNPEALHEG